MCGVVFGLVTLGCGEESPTQCNLPEPARFDFTEVKLETSKSNANCPTIAPSALDTDVLSEQNVCEQDIVDCEVQLTCDYEGLAIHGRVVESEGRPVGQFYTEAPITCLYAVKGKWKKPDDG